jgi:hypothetical protein
MKNTTDALILDYAMGILNLNYQALRLKKWSDNHATYPKRFAERIEGSHYQVYAAQVEKLDYLRKVNGQRQG